MPAAIKAEYLEVFSEPGALTAALNWYRATGLPPAWDFEVVRVPVLWIWGAREMSMFVAPEIREQMPRFVGGPYRELTADGGHWLMQEDTEDVVAAVTEHWAAHDGMTAD